MNAAAIRAELDQAVKLDAEARRHRERAMILILPFLIALPGLVMAEAPPDKRSTATQERRSSAPLTAEEFLDLPNAPAASEKAPKESWIGGIIEEAIGPEATAAREKDPKQQACRKSKTEMEKYENCWLQFIRDTYLQLQHPSDLVELLISKLRLAEKKRITGKISKEEADVLRAEAHVQFESEVARRTSLVRQEEQRRDDQELQMRMLERDIKRSESDERLRRIEYEREQLRRDQEAEERGGLGRALRDMNRSTSQTDCTTDKITNTIHCTTR